MPIQAPRGTYDILPDQVLYFHFLEETARRVFSLYNYQEIRTPIFESTELFSRSIGEETDIVSKEMYTFQDRKGRSLTLRPEGTASVVRAVIEHNILKQQVQTRLYYIGPVFRYERPQAGRQRQFHQTGVEFFGCASPLADAEMIAMMQHYLRELGFANTSVKINTLGNPASRKAYNEDLRQRLAAVRDRLCPDCQKRAEVNPLRVLDCKVPGDQALYKDFPTPREFLDSESRVHFEAVLAALDRMGVNYRLDDNLVRGLDYYTHTVFEVCLEGLGSQDAVLGGGRYDNLVESLDGPPTSAVGAGFGMERLVLAMQAAGIVPPAEHSAKSAVYVLAMDENCLATASELAQQIRQAGRPALFEYAAKGMKAGIRSATRDGARYMAVIGGDELAAGVALFKDLETRDEKRIALADFTKNL